MGLAFHSVNAGCPWCTSDDVFVAGSSTAGWLCICNECERSYYLSNEELMSA